MTVNPTLVGETCIYLGSHPRAGSLRRPLKDSSPYGAYKSLYKLQVVGDAGLEKYCQQRALFSKTRIDLVPAAAALCIEDSPSTGH